MYLGLPVTAHHIARLRLLSVSTRTGLSAGSHFIAGLLLSTAYHEVHGYHRYIGGDGSRPHFRFTVKKPSALGFGLDCNAVSFILSHICWWAYYWSWGYFAHRLVEPHIFFVGTYRHSTPSWPASPTGFIQRQKDNGRTDIPPHSSRGTLIWMIQKA